MQFRASEQQQLLTRGVAEFLTSECTATHVRAAWEDGRHDDKRWQQLATMGVVGLTVPERYGGMGLDERDLVGILIEAGRACLPEPVIETTAVSVPLLVAVGGDLAETWLPRVAAGDAVVVTALPDDPYPAHVLAADLVLLPDENHLYALPPSECTVTPQPNVDEARPTAAVAASTSAAPAAVDDDLATAVVAASARGATAAAAMMVGAGQAMLELAVEHARQRHQFGRPIGTFQAVKHHLADALVGIQFARPLVERAAHSLAVGDERAVLHAAMAKTTAGEAADATARHALQVHGAIGYTWECDLHLWMKRVWSLMAAYGDTETQWQRIESSLLATEDEDSH